MEWGTLRASLDLLLRSERPAVDLVFYGGEPLLELSLIRRAVEHVEPRRGQKKIAYTISTNGLLVDDEALSLLVQYGFRTQLSFDGVSEAQRFRGAGTYRKLDALLDRIRQRHPVFFHDNLRVSLTLTGATVPHLADSIDYLIGKNVQHIDISPVFTHDSAWRAEMIEVLDREMLRVRQTCVRHYRRTGSVPVKLFYRRETPRPTYPRGRAMCGIGRGESLAVDVDGTVNGCVSLLQSVQKYPSPFLGERAAVMRMGDLRDVMFTERLGRFPEATRRAGIFDGKQNKYSSYGRCADCEYFDVCMVCPVSIGHIPGNTDPDRVPDLLCAFQLISQKHRQAFPAQPTPAALLAGEAPIPDLLRELMELST